MASILAIENPVNSMKRQKDMTLKGKFPRFVGAQNATGEEWRNNSRKDEEMEPKQKQCPVVDVTGDGSKAQCCKEQYCMGTWNVRSHHFMVNRWGNDRNSDRFYFLGQQNHCRW